MAESSYPSNQEGKGRAASFNEKLGEFKKFASTSFTRARQVSDPTGWKWINAPWRSVQCTNSAVFPSPSTVHY